MTFPPFCCKMHSRQRHHSLPDACDTFFHASLHIKSPTSTQLILYNHSVYGLLRHTAAVDCVQQPGQTVHSTSNAEIIAIGVVESEILVADFRQVSPLCVIKWKNMRLTGELKTK